MEIVTETEAYTQYDEYLDELEPLNNFGLLFSGLLRDGAPLSYNAGFNDFCSNNSLDVV